MGHLRNFRVVPGTNQNHLVYLIEVESINISLEILAEQFYLKFEFLRFCLAKKMFVLQIPPLFNQFHHQGN